MRVIIILSFIVVLISCNRAGNSQQENAVDPRLARESLEKANRLLVITEEEDIDHFVRRRNWEMTKTGSGLRYMIHDKGTGPEVKRGMLVRLSYTLRLLTGDVIYSSNKDGDMVFMVGRGGVPAGLEEGILLLRKGDKARFILPSHLAYGLLGDDDRIQTRAVLVYEIEVIDLE